MAQAREYRTKWRSARYATRKSQKEITQNWKEETMTEDYDKGEDPDLKLVAIVITLNTYRRIKRQDLLMVYVSNLSTKELHMLESTVLDMTEVNQEIVIIMD